MKIRINRKNEKQRFAAVRGLAAAVLMVLGFVSAGWGQPWHWNASQRPEANQIQDLSIVILGSGALGELTIGAGQSMGSKSFQITSDSPAVITNGIALRSNINGQPEAPTVNWSATLANTSVGASSGTFDALRITGNMRFEVNGGVIAANTGRAIDAGNGSDIRINSGLVIAQATGVNPVLGLNHVINRTGTNTLEISDNAHVIVYVPGAYTCQQIETGIGLWRHNDLSRQQVSWGTNEGVPGIWYGTDGNKQFFATTGVTFEHSWSGWQINPSTCTEPGDSTRYCTVSICGYVDHSKLASIALLNCHDVTWNTDGGTPLIPQTKVISGNAIDAAPAQISKPYFHFDGWYVNGTKITFPLANVTADTEFRAGWRPYVYDISLANGAVPLVNTSTHTFPGAIFGYEYDEENALTVTVANTGDYPAADLFVELSGAGGHNGADWFELSTQTVDNIDVGGDSRTFTVTPRNGLNARDTPYTAAVKVSNSDNGISESFDVSFTVNKATVTSAAISVAAPVKSAMPASSTSGVEISGAGPHSFEITKIEWEADGCVPEPGDPKCDQSDWNPTLPFRGSTHYRVTVTLTADNNHLFAASNTEITATINGGGPSGTGDVITNASTLTLSHLFAKTDAKVITKIEIKQQPAKLSYFYDDNLNLDGLLVRIEYDDKTDADNLKHDQLAAYGISKTIAGGNTAHGNVLSHLLHDNKSIRLHVSGLPVSAYVEPLTVNVLEITRPTMPVQPPSFIYNARVQTYSLVEYTDHIRYYDVSGASQINAEEDYPIVATLGAVHGDNIKWSGESGWDGAVGSWSIQKAPLTITASPMTIKYTDAVPAFAGHTVQYSGFVGNPVENAVTAGLDTNFVFNTDYILDADVGNYNITLDGSTVTADNYDIQFAIGTLTVEALPITVPAMAASQKTTFSTAEQSPYIENRIDEEWYTITDNQATNAAVYTVTAKLKDKDNTVWANSGNANDITLGTWEIAKAEVIQPIVSATALRYSGSEQTVGLDDIDHIVHYDTVGNKQTNAGNYGVTATLRVPANYKWAGIDGAGESDPLQLPWSIARALLTITADTMIITFNDKIPDFDGHGVKYSGFVVGEDLASSDLDVTWLTFATDYTKGSAVGNIYTITPDDVFSHNYDISYVAGMLTVQVLQIEIPTMAASQERTFSTAGQSPDIENRVDEEWYTITGNTETNAGIYTVKVDLTDKDNTEWTNSTTGEITLETWKIERYLLTPSINVSGVTGSRVYNASTDIIGEASITFGTVTTGETPKASAVFEFENANAGKDKNVAATNVALLTNDNGTNWTANYTLNSVTAVGATASGAEITPLQLTASDPTVTATKIYDGNTNAAAAAGRLQNIVGDEDVVLAVTSASYNSKDVLTANLITVIYEITGDDTANYTKPQNYTVAGTITKADPTPPSAPTTADANTAQTLGDIAGQLPSGWTWTASPSTPAGAVGNQTHEAQFIPADQNNFNTLKADVTVTVIIDPQIAIDDAAIAAAKALIEAAVYNDVSQSDLNTKDAAIAAVLAVISALDLGGVLPEIVGDEFIAAIMGTLQNPDGTDGEYTFKVRLSKGVGEAAETAELSFTVNAVRIRIPAGIKFIKPTSLNDNNLLSDDNISPYEVIDVALVTSYTVEIALIDQHGDILAGEAPVRIGFSVRIGNASSTRILETDAAGFAKLDVSLSGSVAGNEPLFTARAQIHSGTVRDTARLSVERTTFMPSSDNRTPAAEKGGKPDTGDITISVNEPGQSGDIGESQSAYLGKSQFTIGPNVAKRGEAVNVFRDGKSIKDGVLMIYDASGRMVSRIAISDGRGAVNRARTDDADAQSRRIAGSWNLKDTKGRYVPAGTYLVRGTVVTSDGKKERVSLMIGIR